MGAFYLVGSLSVLDAWLLARRPVTEARLRGFGWVMSLVAMCTLASLLGPAWSLGPVIGPGGYVGAAGRGFLEMHFASAGAYLLTLSLLVGGLLLCTEYLLPRLLARCCWLRRRRCWRGCGWPLRCRPQRRPLTDPPSRKTKKEKKRKKTASRRSRSAASATKAAVEVEEEEEEDEEEIEEDVDEEEEDEQPAAEDAKQPAAPAREPRFKRPRKSEREEVMQELDAASRTDEADVYELPSIDLLLPGEDVSYEEHEKEVRRKAKILEKTFADFGFNVRVVEIETGPVIAQFEVELEAGLRLSQDHRAWPTIWPSPCACPACGSWPPFPARTRSASKCPTPSGTWSASAK